MVRSLLRVLITLAALSSSSRADSEPATPLAAIPADAVFAARLSRPDESLDRMRALLRKVTIDPRRTADPFAAIGAWIGNPQLIGVETGADWWLVGLPAAKEGLDLVFVVPFDEYATARRFLEGRLGRNRVRRHEAWMVYSTSEKAVARFAAVAEGGDSLETSLDDEQRKLLLDGECSAHLNAATAVGLLPAEGFDPATWIPGAEIDEATRTRLNEVRDDLKTALGSLRGLTTALRLSSGGVGAEVLVGLPESITQPALEAVGEPSRQELLAALPEEQVLYMGLGGLGGPWVRAILAETAERLPRRSETRERLERIGRALEDLQIGDAAGSVGFDRVEEGALRVAKIVAADPKDDVRASLKAEYESASFELAGTSQTVAVTEADATIAGESADRVRVSVRREGPGRKWIDALYGQDGLEGYVVVEEGRFVQTLGGGLAFATEVVRRTKRKDEQEVGGTLGVARGRLPDAAHAVLLVDVPSTIVGVLRLGTRGGALDLPIDPRRFNALDRDRDYTGLSLGLEPAGVRAAVHVPVSQIERLAELQSLARP